MKRDLVIGIVGATILVAAMVGVFRYEASQVSGTAWDVAWRDANVAGTVVNGITQEGETTPVSMEVTHTNVTMATFTLTWVDDIGDPDEFELTVTSPTGEKKTAPSSTSGRIELAFTDLVTEPSPMRIFANDRLEAEQRVAREHTSTAAMGEWIVEVRLVNAGGVTAGGITVIPDENNEWTLKPTFRTYAADLSAV